MQLAIEKQLLIAGKTEYASPKANVATNPLLATAERPLGSFFANVNKEAKKSWRMVYDERRIFALFESVGYTHTIENLFVAETREECVVLADKLGLKVPEDPFVRPAKTASPAQIAVKHEPSALKGAP